MTQILNIQGYKPIYKGVAPFMKYEKGFGYYGVLLEEEASGKLQCHLCGHTVLNLNKHIFHKHKDLTIKMFKEQVGLSLGTPLIAESTRKKFKNNFLNLTEAKKEETIKRLQSLNKKLHTDKTKKQRTNKASLQTNNMYGTCPEQVKSQFYEIYNKLGRLPNWSELTYKLRYILESRFGSYQEGLVAWGIPRQEYRDHINESKIKIADHFREHGHPSLVDDEEVKRQYLEFFQIKRRLPTWGEVRQSGMYGRVPFHRVFKISKKELQKILKNGSKVC